MFSFYSKELKLLEKEYMIKREIKTLDGNNVTSFPSVFIAWEWAVLSENG